MGKFSNYLLVSDIDGTLINSSHLLSKENIDAVNYFIDNGGLFTLATGRSVESAQWYIEQLPIHIPTIHINGACIYDYNLRKYLYEQVLPDDYYNITKYVIEKFPTVGIVSWIKDGACVLPHNNTVNVLQKVEKMGYTICELDNIPVTPYKMLFICENGEKNDLEKFLTCKFNDNVDYVSTSDMYFEMIPKGISKGKTLKKLLDILHIDKKKTIAVGDYFNDIEMIQFAGIGAAVENAHDIVKKSADIVVNSCDNNSVKSLIEYLDNIIK